MQINFKLSENDFIQYYLYTASHTDRIIRQKRRSRFLNSGVILIFGVYFFNKGDMFLSLYFLGAAIVMFFLYPIYMSWHFKKHYTKFVKVNYKDRFDAETSITINENSIKTFDDTGEDLVDFSEIEEIIEISDQIFIKTKNGSGIIIPKNQIENIEIFRTDLKNITQKLSIEYVSELEWKFK